MVVDRLRYGKACIIHNDIDPAECQRCGIKGLLYLVGMGYIQQCRSVSIFAECILEFLACLFQTRCVKVVEHNYRPLLHELLGDSLTDAAGTAGYQGDFSRKWLRLRHTL